MVRGRTDPNIINWIQENHSSAVNFAGCSSSDWPSFSGLAGLLSAPSSQTTPVDPTTSTIYTISLSGIIFSIFQLIRS